MATIVKRTARGRVVYQAKVRTAQGSASRTFDKLTDARRWSAETEGNIRRGIYHDEDQARQRTVGDVLDKYLASPAFDRITEQDTRKAHLKWWRERIGDMRLNRLTPAMIAEGRDALRADGLAPATCNRRVAALSKALSMAARELGWIDANPCGRVEKYVEDNARDRVLSDEEFRRLVDACGSQDLKDLVTLARFTAARRSELTGLSRGDVDLNRKLVTFRDTKNGTTRSVALVGPALDVLQRRLKVPRPDTSLVFPRKRDPSKPAAFKTAFTNAVGRAGLDGFDFHGLRHTALTRLAESGATLSQLQKIAGHKTLAMVTRYQHLTEDATREALERMLERAS